MGIFHNCENECALCVAAPFSRLGGRIHSDSVYIILYIFDILQLLLPKLRLALGHTLLERLGMSIP
jgi:hypothetical protein